MAPKLYGICGPTASGKTELALRVCERVNGEVVSADSMQVYTGMDILSAKPDASELARARHHVIDFVPPEQKYNASKYRSDAMQAIEGITARGHVPLLCGGTGLYIDALTRGIRLSEEADDALRQKLKLSALEENGKARLHAMLSEVDPQSAAKYDVNDTRRVIRSLEIYYRTGQTRGEQELIDKARENTFDACLFALKWDRKALYARIDRRVDDMIKRGLIDEVRSLMRAENSVQETAAQAIGFKEIKQALEGEMTLEDAIEKTKANSRHLAKRQETWFRRDERVNWLDTDGTNFDELADIIVKVISEDGKR